MPGLPLRFRRLRAVGFNARQIGSIGRRRMLRKATGANATASTLTIGATNAAVTYTSPLWRGVTGNSARIAHVISGTNTPLTIVRNGRDYTVNIATNGAAAATSTAAQVAAAWNASTDVSDRGIVASLPGTGASVATAQALTAMTGGTGGS